MTQQTTNTPLSHRDIPLQFELVPGSTTLANEMGKDRGNDTILRQILHELFPPMQHLPLSHNY